MSIKAVDIVLLLEQRIVELAIEANRGLVEKFGSEIVLDKQNCLPHISLAMGCIDENKIPSIKDKLTTIAEQNTVKFLKITRIHIAANVKGQSISSFEIEKTPALQKLHEQITESMTEFFRFEVAEDMIYANKPVSPTIIEWIKNYRDNSSFENFSPHITIGYGKLETNIKPIEFSPAKLALCHLGNHCTCRKVLCAVEIGGW